MNDQHQERYKLYLCKVAAQREANTQTTSFASQAPIDASVVYECMCLSERLWAF